MRSESVGTVLDSSRILDDTADAATQAWIESFPDSPRPNGIEVFKEPRPDGESSVFNLGPVGPGGAEVVAKELTTEAALIERTVYCDVLPKLSISGPALIGFAESREDSNRWLFLEAVTGLHFDKTDQLHQQLAARWLATLHAETADRSFEADLPERMPDFYESRLVESMAGLEEVLANPAISSAGRQQIRRISGHLQALSGGWLRLADAYLSLPAAAVVHGDFKGNNMGFSVVEGRLELRVFDWSEAHWGPMALDLWSIDTAEYQRVLGQLGFLPNTVTIDQWRNLGMLLRLISAVFWELPRLRLDWVERSLRRMTIYERRLGSAIESSVWL